MCDFLDGPRHPERFRARISSCSTTVKHGGYRYGSTRSKAAPSQVVWVQATPRPLRGRRTS